MLVDAKGRFTQFIDDETGDFKKFWQQPEKTGLNGEINQARRQLRVANGRSVTWYCAEQEAADAFQDAFDIDPEIRGRIQVVYWPMPGQER